MSAPHLLPFTKMEGAGNDYVYIDAIRAAFPWPRGGELAQRWADRHFGIGGDGLIVLSRDAGGLRMTMWNGDGSRGAMCGNGLRCIAKLAVDHGHASGEFLVQTDSGARGVCYLGRMQEKPDTAWVRTELGVVSLGEPRTIDLEGTRLTYVPADVGNPHAVVFVPDRAQVDVPRLGLAMQRRPEFPDGVNVEFAQVLAPNRLGQRTYERGSGETLACGTGAAAVAQVARQLGLVTGDSVRIELRGGTLLVRCEQSSLAIEGPARTVFSGSVSLD